MSDASTMMPDMYGRSLRRALDLKVKKLRSLLTADEDITSELDHIVCRLMKLALRTSKDHQTPPSASWMQRKLLDLLTLTEKAIERRRKYFIETYPLKAIEYDSLGDKQYKIENDDTAEKILEKYLTLSSDRGNNNFVLKSEVHYTEDNLSTTSIEMEPFVLEPNSTCGEVQLESVKCDSKEEIRLQITQAWFDGDYDAEFPTRNNITKSNNIISDSNSSNSSRCSNKTSHEMYIQYPKVNELLSSNNQLPKQVMKSKIRERKSKNKLIKKMSKKRSSSGQLAKKYSKNFEFIEYQSYTFIKPRKSFKDHYNLQSTPSKPIPRNLIELCYQDLATEKNAQLIDFSAREHKNNAPNNVAAIKESFFIDIVSEDIEETIALRRTIATEADQSSDIMESEDIFETVINVTKDDSFDGGHVVPVETFNSETIFLYDINEPSTSKGIRHMSADVQCGTDILAAYPTPSAVSSLINVSNIRETGIKIGDSYTNLGIRTNSVDFGMVTDENNFYCDFLSALNKNSIKIKDSATNITNNVECSTMTPEDDLDAEVKLSTNISKVLTNFNANDLRLYRDVSKCRLTRHANQNNIINQKNSLTKYVRPKLSYCGIYIHSYRDRHVSEDVVFQGEWQKNLPKVLMKKNPCAQMILRKPESSIKKKKNDSKENVCPKKLQNKVTQNVEKITAYKQNVRYAKTKQEAVAKFCNIKPNLNNLETNVRNSKKVKKVASKVAMSITTSRSLKNISSLLKTKSITTCNNPKRHTYNNSNRNGQKPCLEYKVTSNVTVDRLNKTSDSIKQALRDKKIPSLIRSKNEDNLLKSKSDKPQNRTYLVFRNEIEKSKSFNSSANSKPLTKLNSPKSNYSPPSQKSSPSSSPSSIATVRLLSSRTKAYSNQNNSPPLVKNHLGNISVEEMENSKTKNYIRKSKLSTVLYENKENLPETSKTWNTFENDAGMQKCSRTKVCDKNKNVSKLQVRTDSSPLTVRRKSENIEKTVSDFNTKLLKSKTPENQQKLMSPLPLKNSPSKKSKALLESKENITDISGDDCSVAEINYMTRSSTPVLQSHSTINAAMKQLIEERLNFFKETQDDSDSETVILSRVNHEESISPISYNTVLTNENTCNISGSEVESALLNYSFESDLNSSPMSTINSTLPSVDTDLLSLRSTESLSKLPSCIQNELDNTLVPQQNSGSVQNSSKPVHDIFERKDQNFVKTTGGLLAVQVFSGFSMDGEPVIGDQSEYISLVDPETGNLALEVARQVTSEELFVSGRSSDTYESCNIEDDSFVPNWLFHVISQQQSAEIPEEAQEFLEGPDDDEEPNYDMNGNTVEAGFAAGVGAGDGHGMHSDQSQDSSGRGSSISSSDVSSGPQSEAILIDPSAFLGSAPVPMSAPTVAIAVESSEASFRTGETMETDNEAHYNRENTQRRRNRAARVSDIDADVSSLETDAADSDN